MGSARLVVGPRRRPSAQAPLSSTAPDTGSRARGHVKAPPTRSTSKPPANRSSSPQDEPGSNWSTRNTTSPTADLVLRSDDRLLGQAEAAVEAAVEAAQRLW